MVHQPWKDKPEPNQNKPGNLFNGMVNPHIPYGIRGAIWYQGESNRGRAPQYRELFPAMIADWREAWGQGDFPFGFVQIAPYGYGNDTGQAAGLREAQTMTCFGFTACKPRYSDDIDSEASAGNEWGGAIVGKPPIGSWCCDAFG